MREGNITTHVDVEKYYVSPINEVKVTSDDIVTMKAITTLTKDWYPNEYHFISEELFEHLLALSSLVTKKIQ